MAIVKRVLPKPSMTCYELISIVHVECNMTYISEPVPVRMCRIEPGREDIELPARERSERATETSSYGRE